jgi:hypothetical protein
MTAEINGVTNRVLLFSAAGASAVVDWAGTSRLSISLSSKDSIPTDLSLASGWEETIAIGAFARSRKPLRPEIESKHFIEAT